MEKIWRWECHCGVSGVVMVSPQQDDEFTRRQIYTAHENVSPNCAGAFGVAPSRLDPIFNFFGALWRALRVFF